MEAILSSCNSRNTMNILKWGSGTLWAIIVYSLNYMLDAWL